MESQLSPTDDSKSDQIYHPGKELIGPEEWPAIAHAFGLTIREWEVVVLLFHGRTRQAIARKLSISSRTVRQYLEQVYLKLEVQDRVELVLKIVECRDRLRT